MESISSGISLSPVLSPYLRETPDIWLKANLAVVQFILIHGFAVASK